MEMQRRYGRRTVLGAAAAGIGGVLVGCGGGEEKPREDAGGGAENARAAAPVAQATVSPTVLVRPAGVSRRVLLGETPSETEAVIRHSGKAGPAVVVLGGVHGNEPGGWLAADQVAEWEPLAGSLIVMPRANVQAIAGFVRTTEAIGDLNRFYPGNLQSGFLMERMAAEILRLAGEFGATLLLDLHESWGFYEEYGGGGTAALGQTITAGVGPDAGKFGQAFVTRLNESLGLGRERLIARDGSAFRRPTVTPVAGATPVVNRGRSSLSAGGYVPGLTPVLVEMGQESQPVQRRVELHLAVTRAALETAGVL